MDLKIASGEFVAITGKSGCGKSTLCCTSSAAWSRLPRGRVLLAGRDLAQLKEPELTRFRRDQVGVVFQSFNLLPLLTLAENVALPRVLQGLSVYPGPGRSGALADGGGPGGAPGHQNRTRSPAVRWSRPPSPGP